MTIILEQGTLQGQYFKTQVSNKPYVRFLGIPYAKPPIQDLRFKVYIYIDCIQKVKLYFVLKNAVILYVNYPLKQ